MAPFSTSLQHRKELASILKHHICFFFNVQSKSGAETSLDLMWCGREWPFSWTGLCDAPFKWSGWRRNNLISLPKQLLERCILFDLNAKKKGKKSTLVMANREGGTDNLVQRRKKIHFHSPVTITLWLRLQTGSVFCVHFLTSGNSNQSRIQSCQKCQNLHQGDVKSTSVSVLVCMRFEVMLHRPCHFLLLRRLFSFSFKVWKAGVLALFICWHRRSWMTAERNDNKAHTQPSSSATTTETMPKCHDCPLNSRENMQICSLASVVLMLNGFKNFKMISCGQKS